MKNEERTMIPIRLTENHYINPEAIDQLLIRPKTDERPAALCIVFSEDNQIPAVALGFHALVIVMSRDLRRRQSQRLRDQRVFDFCPANSASVSCISPLRWPSHVFGAPPFSWTHSEVAPKNASEVTGIEIAALPGDLGNLVPRKTRVRQKLARSVKTDPAKCSQESRSFPGEEGVEITLRYTYILRYLRRVELRFAVSFLDQSHYPFNQLGLVSARCRAVEADGECE